MGGPALSHLPRLRLRKGRLKRVASGHPWVFSNELQEVPPLEPGALAVLDGPGGEPLGTGYFNPRTLIAFRWIARGADPEPDWLERRVAAAVARRRALYPGEECVRLAFGEADGLPGLVADRYGDAVVLQCLTAGMERLRERAEAALRDAAAPRLLVRKDDSPARALEGLARAAGWEPAEERPVAEARYLGLRFRLDFEEAQKTGLFLDQRENVRALLARLSPGARLLDVFCYRGAWGLAALRAGAREVQFVDASAVACAAVEAALAENGLPESTIHRGDAFEVLSALRHGGEKFDAVVVDPPAFAKSRKHLAEALKAYGRLNALAMALVAPGGLLATCSCSHHVGREEFRELLRETAARAAREARLVEFRGHAPDHPVLLSFPEGDYLKCAIIRLA